MNQELMMLPVADAVTANDAGKAVTTSFAVAEVFGKRHSDVLRAIRKLIDDADGQIIDFTGRNFALKEINRLDVHEKFFVDVYYEITKSGFSLLVMGFTGAKARTFKVSYIEAFDRMEQHIAQSLIGKDSERVMMLTKQAVQSHENLISMKNTVTRLEKRLNQTIAKIPVLDGKPKNEPLTSEERQEIMEHVEEYIKDKHFFEVLEVKKALGLPVSAHVLSKWFTHRYGPSRVTMHKCAWRRVYTNPLVKEE